MPWIIDAETPGGAILSAKVTSANWLPKHDSQAVYQFRLTGAEGKVQFYGRSTVNNSFAPLDDFGLPNAGCTSIEYLNRKCRWEVL